MGTGEKGTKLNKDAVLNPPPGTYSLDSHADKHGISFGKDTRDKTKLDGLPGPGTYAVPSTLDNKGISIKGKQEEKIPYLSPGPGAYNSKDDLAKAHGGTASFGKEPKNSGPKDNKVPGPGMYKIESPLKGGHIFGRDPRDKNKKTDSPGPGQYNTRKEEGLTYF